MFTFQFRTLVLSAFLISTTHAANLDLSPVPLYLGGSVEPNIMFTLDDSGSMHWEFMPEENRRWTLFVFPRPASVYGGADYNNQLPNFDDTNIHNFFGRSSNNTIFYNPDTTYLPWSNPDGTSMGDATPTAALYNIYNPGAGNIDLTVQQTQNACWFENNGDINTVATAAYGCPGNHTYWPITYYIYNGGNVETRANYTRVQIGPGGTPATFTSPSGIGRTRAEETQNFANWFQYFRSRVLLARAGVGRAFARQGTNMRVGFAAINQGGATIDGVASVSAMIQGVRPFSGADRTTFFNNLYGHVMPAAGTPLVHALDDVGKYFERTDNSGPWSETPGTSSGAAHLQCRQSYNILMTDGYWNSGTPGTGNIDNTDGNVISGPNNPNFQYIASAANEPYDDVWSNTLADTAMLYWNRDLRPSLSNEVPTNSIDDAFWQNMVTFTVGLGVTGTLDPLTDLPGLKAGTTTWPQAFDGGTTVNIDDMWHAALNSRGEFFSASNPTAFADRLSEVLSAISDRTSSASSVALNSGTVSGSSKVYQARFDSGDWSGQLFAFPVNADGTLGGLLWDAASLIPAANSRTIVTYDGSDGQPFRWGDISAAQQTLLGSQAILDYLRGDQANEADNGGTYRNRNALLGDIIHSSPTYVGVPALRYPNGLGTNVAPKNYSAFKSANSARQHIVYANANDGMLHGFNADTGVEMLAYVPNAIMNKLPDLANINYNHKYYVDGSPTVLDAFFDNDWHTVLVSGLRSGGQGIFAIDVTDPTNFSSETSADDEVLWEFTDTDDSDLGYTFGLPSIVKMQNGKWAAVFSGGYNNTFDDDGDGAANDSATGNAVLFIVDIEDGSLIAKIDTKIGSAQDPTGNNKPNGLATPSVVDIDGDFVADAIYAGDLFGNVWKFDVSDNNEANWKTSYGTVATPIPLYTACAAATCNATNHQPITTQVQVIRHPSRGGYLVLFGTGKYFEVGDNSTVGQTTQTYYSIWDKAEVSLTAFDRGDLLQQEIIKELTAFSYDLRVSTENAMVWYDGSTGDRGWYMDLINTEGGNTNNYGERQVSNSIVRNGRIIFTTLLPSDDPCDFGGSGWLMELDLYTGARLQFSPFDLNDDGSFLTTDYVNAGDLDGDGVDDYVPVSGKKSKV
ncbi:MAG: pilus assembly protein PilY, partial [Gammaproteobacteria bacterium]